MTLEQIAEQIKAIDQKLDLVVGPVKEDVTEIKGKVDDHADRIKSLEGFKEGHQREHEEGTARRRFNWEILVGSGIIGGFIKWVSG